ncbi:MAG: glycosyltransferase family A protein, partial [Candidatus Thorarchaeota archaeon]
MDGKDRAFPYHLHCEFCQDQCQSPGETSARYVQFTNVWNERDNIEAAFERTLAQTKRPRVWIWIDDGSVDGTADEILRVAEENPEIEVWLERMPAKSRGNLNTIGRAYTAIVPGLVDRLDSLGIRYFTIQDVDTEPCPNYFARIIWLLENEPTIGA